MILFVNNYHVIIVSPVGAADTSVAVSSTVGLPVPGPADFIKVTLETTDGVRREIVHVTGFTGSVLTIVRGQEGTTPQSFAINDVVQARLTAAILNLIDQNISGAYLRLDGQSPMTGDLTIETFDVALMKIKSAGTKQAGLDFYQGGIAKGRLYVTDPLGQVVLRNTEGGAVQTQIVLNESSFDFSGGPVKFDSDVRIDSAQPFFTADSSLSTAGFRLSFNGVDAGDFIATADDRVRLRKFSNLGAVTAELDITDDVFSFVGGHITIDAGFKVIAPDAPTSGTHLTNKTYVDAADAVLQNNIDNITIAASGVIIGGRIRGDGTIQTGNGFTVVRTGLGIYIITSDIDIGSNSFVVTATIAVLAGYTILYYSFGSDFVEIRISDANGIADDSYFAFAFLAI